MLFLNDIISSSVQYMISSSLYPFVDARSAFPSFFTHGWTALECFILAQAVHKWGEYNWPIVSNSLKQHPALLRYRSADFFTQKVIFIL